MRTIISTTIIAAAVATFAVVPVTSAARPRPVDSAAASHSGAHRTHDRRPDVPTVAWPRRGEVALTFDDGPVSDTTNAVLDVLRAKGVPATFFVNCYRLEAARSAVFRMVDEGHSIQNHTTHHPWLVRLPSDQAYTELKGCSDDINRFTWERPTLFRPPYGSTSPRIDAIASSVGLRRTMWNATPTSMLAGTEQIIRELMRQITMHRQYGEGVVVLLHDGSGNRAGQVAALGPLIDWLVAGDWRFVRLGDERR